MALIDSKHVRVLLVGVRCAEEELARREAQRGDRPAGLARRSLEACHANGLPYDVELNTDQQPTEDSVAAIVTALQALTQPELVAAAPLTHRTGTELLGMLKAGAVSSSELLEAFLTRVAAKNGAVNAVVVLDAEGARGRATEMDQLRAAGAELGPLHGLPITIKNHPPAVLPLSDESELLVTQLLAAGAVIFGYTNTPKNASDVQTYNEKYGTTSNPHDLKRTPGGSSGGSAAGK